MSLWHKVIYYCYFVLLCLVPLFFTPLTTELFELPKFVLVCLVSIFIAFFWLLRMILARQIIFTKSPLDIPLIIFLASLLVSFLFSVDKSTSLWGYYSRQNGGLISWLCYALIYWAAVSNLTYQNIKSLLKFTLITALFIAIYGILESLGYSISCLIIKGQLNVACWKQSVSERVFATLGQPNWLASYLLALLFIPLAKILKTKSQSPNKPKIQNTNTVWGFKIFNIYLVIDILCLVFLATMLWSLFLTHSRSGLLALAIGLVVYLSFTYSKKILYILIPIILASSIYIYFLSTKHKELSTLGTESLVIRAQNVWPGAISAWLHSPKTILFGWGPENFYLAYHLYRPKSHNLTSEWRETYNKAHNEYLNFLTTTGILGLFAYVYLLFLMSKTMYDYSVTTSDNRMPIAFLSGWTTLLVTNFWGFSTTISNTLLLLLPSFAFISSPNHQISHKKINPTLNIALIIMAFAILGLIYPLARFALADIALKQSRDSSEYFVRSQDTSYLLPAFESAQLAYQLRSTETNITSELAYSAALLSAALAKNDASLSAQFAKVSLQSANHSLLLSPLSPHIYRSTARSLMILGNIDNKYLELAKQALLAGWQYAPTDPIFPATLYQIFTDEKNASESATFIQATLELKPDYQF